MVRFGYVLASEEFGPHELVRQARLAENAGFERLWISDHFHPWINAQGQSPFVWSVIGALSETTTLPITTAVTCPTMRIHPAVIGQASATAAAQLHGRFTLGVGSGEALNEHILGDPWPSTPIRLEMLEEAVELIRTLHRGGQVDYTGRYYTVRNARVYTLPAEPVPIYVSAFGPRAARLAGKIGDGFISVRADAELVSMFRGCGGDQRPAQAGMKVCYAESEERGVRTAHRLWPNIQLPGELGQILPTPRHVEQACTLVTPEATAASIPCGPDPVRYLNLIDQYVAAGYDEIYVQQIGPEQDAFFRFWSREVASRVRELVSAR